MQLEFHQLDRRWEHLRVHHPARQRRLLASLAESGQQVPIVVVAADGQPNRYVVIDGHKRVTALHQLGRDKVDAVVWPMNEADAIVLDRSLRLSEWVPSVERHRVILAEHRSGKKSVAGWAYQCGKGRIVFTAVGHTNHAMWIPAYFELQKRAV